MILTSSSAGQKIVQKYEKMKSDRVNWDEYWEELAEYFIPNKDDVYGFRMEGERKHNKLYDSTSIHSLEMLSSSLHGMLTNPASVWMGLSSGNSAVDQIPEVSKYLQQCTRIVIDVLNQSNFQEEIHETYLDLGGIGTTVLDMEEDDDTHIRFKSNPIYGSYICENSKGIVDTLARCYKMTLRQIKQKYGEDIFKKHLDLQSAFDKDCEQKEEIIFLVETDPDNKGKWKRTDVLRKHFFVLKESTYHSWPFAVPRWTKLNSEVYGRCPAMKCLPDVKMLNAMMKATIRGLQKSIDPPLMVPDNGFLLPIKTSPNSTNFYRTGMKDRIEIFPTASRPDIGENFMEQVRSRVREAFFYDQMQLINQRDMTATEVMQRTDERLRFLGPILGRLNNELLKPIIDRVFDICSRRGLFPKPPIELKDFPDLKIIYTSQIAKAQRTAESNTLQKVIQASLPVLQSQPDAMDNFNADSVVRKFAVDFGLPNEFLNDPKSVTETRKARAESQAQQNQAQTANVEADTAQKMAKARTA